MRSLVSLAFAIICMQSASVLGAPQGTTTVAPFTLPTFTIPTFSLPPLPTFPTIPNLLNISLPTFTLPPISLPTFSLEKRSIASTEPSQEIFNCKDNNGKVRENDTIWIETVDTCVVYSCTNGVISSTTDICSTPFCKEPFSFPGECCLQCSRTDNVIRTPEIPLAA